MKYSIGDRVRVINLGVSGGDHLYIGQECSITAVNVDKYSAKFDNGVHYGLRDSEVELVTKSNNKSMSSIKSIYKALRRGEPEATFVKVGIMNDNEELTTEGKEMFTDFLFKKFAAEFKTEVADPILAEMAKEEK